ncbi:MAG: MraY family glycosyltransferase [Bryobacteraceae bacterium]
MSAVVSGWLAGWLRRRGVMDIPNERSSHSAPTPRGGGVAVLAGAAAGLALLHGWQGTHLPSAGILAAVALMALAGLADDVRGLPAWLRLLVQSGCAALVLAGGLKLERLPLPAPLDLPAGALAPLLTWLWLVGVTNLFNFLDGIDGYAGWQTVLACAGAALLGLGEPVTAAAICLGGAAVGFLAWNWHPARIFLGDVGSTAIGFFLALAPLAAPVERRPEAVFTMAMLLWFFLSDGAYTLLRRLVQGEKIWSPHRSHLYQQLARRLGRHDAVVVRIGAAGTLVGAVAVAAYVARDPGRQWAVLGMAVALFLVYRHRVEHARRAPAAAAAGRQTA